MSGSSPDPEKPRTFYYVSPRKIRMLLEEYKPPGWQTLLANIAEVGGNIGGAGGTVVLTKPADRPKSDPLPALRAVLKKLKGTNGVHSLDDNAELLHGSLDMYSAIVEDPATGTPVFLTVGATERSIIALGGNALNMWGGGSDQPHLASDIPVTEPSVLAALMEADEKVTGDVAAHSGEDAGKSPNELVASYTADLYYAWPFNKAGTMRYEIFMQQQRRTPLGPPYNLTADMQVVIGSPIFVAQAL